MTRHPAIPSPGPRAEITLCAIAITALVVVAYANSFSGPFIFDDPASISKNPTIRNWSTAFSPPPNSGLTVSGRPLLNFSFAVNHAISGEAVWSYHLVNLLLHAASTLTLFGVVRRTLLQKPLRLRFGREATFLAAAAAALWGLHPLQTESVTYIVQRAESLAGLLYLLTLYGFIRGSGEPPSRPWLGLSVICCFLGMAGKEIMVSAPPMVLLYDWLFVSPSLRDAGRRRWRYYLAIFLSWGILALLIWLTGNRGGTAGLSDEMPWWAYALTQCEAIVLYLSLFFAPVSLTIDYGIHVVDNWTSVWPQALLLLALGGATLAALVRRKPVAFPLVWFFVILAPTSSVVPVVSQTMAEHRMYLPLAGPAVLLVIGLRLGLKKWAYPVSAVLALAAAFLTFQRNFDYESAERIWKTALSTRPRNERAWNALGNVYYQQGRLDEAMKHYECALSLSPDSAQVLCNLGAIFGRAGQLERAIAYFRKASERDPAYADAHLNWGFALFLQGDIDGAVSHFQQGAKLAPGLAEAHKMLGEGLRRAGRAEEAAACFAEAERVDPFHLQKPKFFHGPASSAPP